MITAPSTDQISKLPLIEGSLTLVGVGLAFCFPRLGSRVFRTADQVFTRIARQKRCFLLVGLAALLCRLAIIPLSPVPHPAIHDDFSFLLAADTFASGRLTNPTPVMWTHFETAHETMVPTYMSMYFPGQGLILAAGKLLTGNPWYGLLAVNAVMCAALCWMLQGWLPSKWALLGGIIAILRVSLFSYWINMYSGGGALDALGGALILGGLPRFMKRPRSSSANAMGIGISILAVTRPYECALLCLGVCVVFVGWWRKNRGRLDQRALIRASVVPLILLVAVAAWLGYYDFRAFGNPVILPYTLDRQQYALTRYFIWQHRTGEHVYRSGLLRDFYIKELQTYEGLHSRFGYTFLLLQKATLALYFFAGFALLPPLLGAFKAICDKRIRPLVVCLGFLVAGEAIQIHFFPHYIAAFTGALYALGLQAARHLRQWRPEGAPVGAALLGTTFVLCTFLVGLRLFADPLHLSLPTVPTVAGTRGWYGPAPSSGEPRAEIEALLGRRAGRDLVIVRYGPAHNAMDDWVYNAANIDRSEVIWARDLGPTQNAALIRYYSDRNVWLVEPDTSPVRISSYSLQLAMSDKHSNSVPE